MFLEIEFGMCYSWFSHDFSKIQTCKLSLLVSFYFHLVLEHLKTFIQTNSRSKRVVRFAIQDALISRLLHDTAFSWRRESSYVGLRRYWFWEISLSKHNYYFNLWVRQPKSSRISMETQKQMFLFVSGDHICAPKRDTSMGSLNTAL